MVEKEYYELYVDEPEEYEVEFIEAKIKPEVVGHATPTEEAQTVTPAPGTTFSAVELDAIPPEYVKPVGTKNITEDGDYNVTEFAAAHVAVPQGVFPEGTLEIEENGTGINVTNYAAVDVNVNPSGWVFDEYDDDGKPTRARFFATENYHEIAQKLMWDSAPRNQFIGNITKIELSEGTTKVGNSAFSKRLIKRFVMPSTVTDFGEYAFRYCAELEEFDYMGDCYLYYYDFSETALKRLTAHKNVTRITGTRIFPATTELIDFSHCTSVPPLSHVDAFELVVSCRLLVPAALLTDWQNATNWNALTNVTFEGV